jgi:hypothetical protein
MKGLQRDSRGHTTRANGVRASYCLDAAYAPRPAPSDFCFLLSTFCFALTAFCFSVWRSPISAFCFLLSAFASCRVIPEMTESIKSLSIE